MHHYLDIRILKDPEFPQHQLMAALYAKLHRALVANGTTTVGVSFPKYSGSSVGLGSELRLIGPPADLDALMASDWLKGMREHTQCDDIAPVPASATNRSLRRVQAKSSPARIRRRQMRRHGLTPEEAEKRVPDNAAQKLRLPFIQIASTSTGQLFRLYLSLGPEAETAVSGDFNSYGLSATATIPWF